MTDPLSFVVGALLLVLYAPKQIAKTAATESEALLRAAALGLRAGMAAYIAVVLTLPIVSSAVFPTVDSGDQVAYGLTLFLAGALTLLPGRLEDLRQHSAVNVSGTGYPEELRRRMRDVELFLVVVAVVLIAIWGIRVGVPNHRIPRGIVWGVLAVSVADLLGYGSAIALAQADTITQELTKP